MSCIETNPPEGEPPGVEPPEETSNALLYLGLAALAGIIIFGDKK